MLSVCFLAHACIRSAMVLFFYWYLVQEVWGLMVKITCNIIKYSKTYSGMFLWYFQDALMHFIDAGRGVQSSTMFIEFWSLFGFSYLIGCLFSSYFTIPLVLVLITFGCCFYCTVISVFVCCCSICETFHCANCFSLLIHMCIAWLI